MFTTFDSTLLLMKGLINYINKSSKKIKKEIIEESMITDEQLFNLMHKEGIIDPASDSAGALYVDKNEVVFLL